MPMCGEQRRNMGKQKRKHDLDRGTVYGPRIKKKKDYYRDSPKRGREEESGMLCRGNS